MQNMNVNAEKKLIHLVTIKLNKHAENKRRGMPGTMYRYAYAANSREAEQVATAWLTTQGCAVSEAKANSDITVSQDPSKYIFPHQIINLPQVVLNEIYEQRGSPITWRDPARSVQQTILQ